MAFNIEFSVKTGQPEKQRSDCLIVGVFESKQLSETAEKLDNASDGYISNLQKKGDLDGKMGQFLLLHHVPGIKADRLLLIGCGQEDKFSATQFTKITQKVISILKDTGVCEAVSFLPQLNVQEKDLSWNIKKSIESTQSTLYDFAALKQKKSKKSQPLKRMIYMLSKKSELTQTEKAIQEGLAISKGMHKTKFLADLPANVCTPTYLAKEAKDLDKKHQKIQTTILEEKDIRALKMGAFLAVTQGSQQPAKLITLTYKGTSKKTKPVVLIGKGITFDTGGLSLKPAGAMMGMKYDMCGAATVLGVFEAIAELNLPIHLVGVIPTCENMPGGKATRPDDIVTTMSGLTVEIKNTDAEGRLILADALTYSEKFKPEVVIDIATLTGACISALGRHASGLMSNHDALAQDLLEAGNNIFDRAWHLPLWDEYHTQIKSPFADIANIGGPEAGTITAGCFLAKFAKKYHWAHLDIAGTATHASSPKKGATGRPVPLLVQYLINQTTKTK